MTASRNGRSALILAICTALLAPMLGSGAWAQEDATSIAFEVYACPEAGSTVSDPERLAEQCQDEAPPVGMLVSNSDGYFQVTGQASPGAVPQRSHLEGVPPGEVQVQPQVPEGYGTVVIICAAGDADPEAVRTDFDGTATLNLQAGQPQACQVFVFASPGIDVVESSPAASPVAAASTTLSLAVHGCPSGFEAADSPAGMLDACPGHPVTALYVSDLPGYFETKTTTGTAGSNIAEFSVPAGDITILRMAPKSFAILAVFCTDDPDHPNDPAALRSARIISGGAIEIPVDPAAQVTCHWFTDGGGADGTQSANAVEVRAWDCEAGTDPAGGWSSLYRNCATPDAATSFTLTGSAGELEGESRGEWTAWQNVVPGSITIQGAAAGENSVPVVTCESYSGDRTRIVTPPVANGQFTAEIVADASQVVTCDWFNIPAASGTDASDGGPSLEVSVFTCPSFTYVGPGDCVVDDSGVDFTLLQWNGDPAVWAWESRSMVQVGGNGEYSFEDLEAGDYWPLANGGAWCHVESDNLDASGRWIDVEPGAITTVHLYSCSSPDA